MRFLGVCAAASAVVASPFLSIALAASAQLAPADRYFGRYNQSVLEVRNRLAVIESRPATEMRGPAMAAAIDREEDAVLEWGQKYPTDPWAADAMMRVVQAYARAGMPHCGRATAVFAALTNGFPRSLQVDKALLAIFEAPVEAPVDAPIEAVALTGQAVVVGQVVDASTGAPVAGAVVIVAPNHESSDLAVAPFATTAADGSFTVTEIPAAQAEYVVVEPPRASRYAPYRETIAATDGKNQAGVIRLVAH